MSEEATNKALDLNLITPEFIAKLLHEQTEAITEKPFILKNGEDYSINDDSMIPEGKQVHEISIRPLKVITVVKLTPLCLQISKEDLKKIIANKKFSFNPQTLELLSKYSELILDIICIGIHNKKGDSPPWFKEFLKVNFTWEDLHVFLNAVFFRMGHQSFYKSTTLVSRMGPMSDKGIIACQKNLKTHLTSTK